MTKPLRIATRKSPLAIWQAEEVQRRLKLIGSSAELVKMTTRGDQIIDRPLASIGGKGLFVKELQRGMLENRADLAVHSMKDVPPDFPQGLHLSVILKRENPTDALVSNHYTDLDQLPHGARIGTCSLRRQCQLLEKYPHLKMFDLRGNVNTRLRKLDDGEFDAIILASAGLIRLGMQQRIALQLPPATMLPASAQGAIGIECKSDDTETNELLSSMHDTDTACRVSCERSLNAALGGSCQTPIASYAELKGDTLTLRGLIGLPDGTKVLRAEGSDHRDNAFELGQSVAQQLLKDGAQSILDVLAH